MLICKNGRLYAGQSSFALPDGCKINDAPLAAYRNIGANRLHTQYTSRLSPHMFLFPPLGRDLPVPPIPYYLQYSPLPLQRRTQRKSN